MMNNNISGQVRLFISSTFQDMHKERDYLVNHIFPRIEEYCNAKYLSFIPIDLRWGITEEESRNGKVIEACLEEVDNSRPFFVGIIGQRYGWVPSKEELSIRNSLLNQNYPWLHSYLDSQLSITEIEMQYAALNQEKTTNAVFFIRNDSNDIPDCFKDIEGDEGYTKLNHLKNKIYNQKSFPVYNFSDITEMGELLYKEVISMIDLEYPHKETIFRSQHEFIMAKRANVDTHMNHPREDLLKWIDSKHQVLVIRGSEGAGKSTTLCWLLNWVRQNMSSIESIYYDMELPVYNVDVIDQMSRYIDEIVSPDNNKEYFVAIDNLHVLNNDDICKFDLWIRDIPKNIRIILTTRSSSLIESVILHRYYCPTITVHGFYKEMAVDYTNGYLHLYGKKITDSQMDELLGENFPIMPIVLKHRLDPLINFGLHEELDNAIKKFAKNTDQHCSALDFISKLIQDYKAVLHDNTIPLILTCISLVNKGLSETELIAISGCTQIQWSMIRSRVLKYCDIHGVNIQFSSQDYAQAVKNILPIPYRVSIIKRAVNYFINTHNSIKRQSEVLSDLYHEWVMLPSDNEQEVLEEMLSLRLCVPLINNMDQNQITTLIYKCVFHKIKPENKSTLSQLGSLSFLPHDSYTEEEELKYLTKMRNTYLYLGQTNEALYYEKKIKRGHIDRVIYEAEIYLMAEEAEKVLSMITSVSDITGAIHYKAMLLKCKALYKLGRYKEAIEICMYECEKGLDDSSVDTQDTARPIIELGLLVSEIMLDNPDETDSKSILQNLDLFSDYYKGVGLTDQISCMYLYLSWRYNMLVKNYQYAYETIIKAYNSAIFSYGHKSLMWNMMSVSMGRTQIIGGLNEDAACNILWADSYNTRLQADKKYTIDALYELSQITWYVCGAGSFGMSHLERIENYIVKNNYPKKKLDNIRTEIERCKQKGSNYKRGRIVSNNQM